MTHTNVTQRKCRTNNKTLSHSPHAESTDPNCISVTSGRHYLRVLEPARVISSTLTSATEQGHFWAVKTLLYCSSERLERTSNYSEGTCRGKNTFWKEKHHLTLQATNTRRDLNIQRGKPLRSMKTKCGSTMRNAGLAARLEFA
eukprot:5563517-Amphidinium_carterae.1